MKDEDGQHKGVHGEHRPTANSQPARSEADALPANDTKVTNAELVLRKPLNTYSGKSPGVRGHRCRRDVLGIVLERGLADERGAGAAATEEAGPEQGRERSVAGPFFLHGGAMVSWVIGAP